MTTTEPSADAPVLSRSPLKELSINDDATLKVWLEQMQTGRAIRVYVKRVRPKVFEGVKVDGELETYDGPFDVEELREKHKGGTYNISVHRVNNKTGVYEHVQTRQLEIPGEPSLDGLRAVRGDKAGQGQAGLGADVVSSAMGMMRDLTKDAQAQAREARDSKKNGGTDMDLIRVMQEPLLKQIDALHADRRALESRLNEALNKTPDTSRQDKLLDKMIDGESGRLDALRERHASELRMIQEGHRQDIERLHASYKDQVHAMERAHERELSNAQRSHDIALSSQKSAAENTILAQKTSLEMHIEGHKQTINRLERELAKQDEELARLRAQKDKGLPEQLGEFAALKASMEEVGIINTSEKEEGASTLERVAGMVMNSDIVRGIGARIATTQPITPAQQQQAALNQAIANMPVGQPMRLPDGRVIMKREDGQIVQMPSPRRKKKKSPEQAEAEKRAATVRVAPETVAKAVQYIETAINNGTPPEAFAASARLMMDNAILQALKTKGVDYFLSDVAQLTEDSPLLTQAGKNWARRVGKLLVGEE